MQVTTVRMCVRIFFVIFDMIIASIEVVVLHHEDDIEDKSDE